MQLEANADTSAEDESFGPQLVSRLEVGVQSALEPLPNTPAAPFPSDQVVSENRVAKFSLGFCPKKNRTKQNPHHARRSVLWGITCCLPFPNMYWLPPASIKPDNGIFCFSVPSI